MALPLERVWSRFNSDLMARLGPERYETWIRHVRLARLDDDEVVVHFPSEYVKEKVEALCRPAVHQTFRRLLRGPVEIVFAVERTSFVLDGAATAEPPPPPAEARRHDQTFESFIPGSKNRFALRAARAFVDREPPAVASLFLHAPIGSGKTHLLRAIAHGLARRGLVALGFSSDQFHRQFAYARQHGLVEAFRKKIRTAEALLVDDIDLLADKSETQKELVLGFLALAERRKRIAVTAERPARTLDGMSRFLQQRLRADLELKLEAPDGETALQILRRHAPAGTSEEVLEYITCHVRSGPGDLLSCLDHASARGTATLPSARAAVTEFLSRWSGGLGFEDIARAASQNFRVPVGDIYSEKRTRAVADARQACFFLSRKMLRRPYALIGRHFGGRDHATVLLACRKMTRARDAELKEKLGKMEEDLKLLCPATD